VPVSCREDPRIPYQGAEESRRGKRENLSSPVRDRFGSVSRWKDALVKPGKEDKGESGRRSAHGPLAARKARKEGRVGLIGQVLRHS